MTTPVHVRTWPSLSDVPQLYPDARNRRNRYPLLYRGGKSFALTSAVNTQGRTALLAVGSNGYPRQLSDKLAGTEADLHGVPLVPALLSDFDVAFCPVRTTKGYVPVSLAARPGAVCLTWIQWLTAEQLDIISSTEGSRYALVGGRDLASRARISSRWRVPAKLYAWWFDSLLSDGESPTWLDVHSQQRLQQFELEIDNSEVRPNPIPAGWQVVPRDPEHRRIEPNNMAELC
ncbi:MAG: hypothetical protein OXG27_01950 [Chloroflexi bacterium]|nr:hypothetical protein [Chloroflexota bacterium]